MSSGIPTVCRGRLFVVSAPSGTGKTTVVETLVGAAARRRAVALLHLAAGPGRRARRRRLPFRARATASRRWSPTGEFLEWADVFGNLYGTCGAETERLLLGRASDVILVIDVQGAQAGPRARPRARLRVRAAALVRGSRAAAARPQQGQRRGHPAPAGGGVVGGDGLSRLRLRGRQRRPRRGRRRAAGDRPRRAGARAPDAAGRRRIIHTFPKRAQDCRAHGPDCSRRQRRRRRLQGRRARARAAEARPRGGRHHDPRRAAVRGTADLRGDHAAGVITDQWEPGPTPRSSTSR